tara:strand:+ start:96 stop:2300 length:2205 start_codon:yes stop_codon:yes gene_type:complete
MAAVTTELKVLVRAVGKNDLDKISASLTKLGKAASSAVNPKVKQSVGELKKLSDQSVKTRANIQGFSNAFKDLANNLEFGSSEFKQATAEAAALDAQLKKLETRKPPTAAQRLRRGAQTAGAIAAGGVFGGPEGAIGAGIGGIVGGPAGAAVGAALGAQVGGLRQAAGATAEYAANIAKLRIALQGVTTSQEEYSQGLEFIRKTTKDFAIPQEVVTRQFTKLQASVQGAGGNLEDTKTAFNGIVAAVRATGGSLADVDAALTATAQVFSKGKVSAEELRQQIGERLPGAFTLFAESMGITPQELDKALEQGKVSLQDFQGFAEAIFARYGENAQTIARSPKSAGDQLKVALEELNESVGTLLGPIGAAFQTTFKSIVDAINSGIKALNDFLGIGTEGAINKAQRELDAALAGYERFSGIDVEQLSKRELAAYRRSRARVQIALQSLEEAQAAAKQVDISRPEVGTGLPSITEELDKGRSSRERKDISEELLRLGRELNEARLTGNEFLIVTKQLKFDIQKITESELLPNEKALALEKASVKANERILSLMSGKPAKVKELTQELTETEKLFESIKDTVATGLANAIQGLIDGTKSLGESLSGILKQLGGMFLQFGMKTLVGSLFADGGVVANNKIVPFAYGGVVNKPTLFPMANGAGLMGEAGPEAIMPLRRTASGRLGVESSGGVGNVVVNVDATGSSVQGDQPSAEQLGRAIGQAVQAELIKQKRPGGLLTR